MGRRICCTKFPNPWGYYASESLTFEGNVSFPNFTFLCGKNSSVGFEFQHTSGSVGMSRGRLSLVSQLNVSRFSYCLPGLGSNSTGTFRIGGPSSTAGGGERVTTNDSAKSQFYYVSVEGISVGKTRLASVPKEAFQLNRNGSGGMIVDTGTSLTYLPTAAFNAVVGEVHKQLKLPWYNNSDLPCFTLPQRSNGISFPTLTLHLQGAHASAATNLSLPEENVFIIEEDEGRNTTCLAIVDAGGGGSFGVLGNFVQQNMMMSYDLAQNTLSFEPTNCSRHSSF